MIEKLKLAHETTDPNVLHDLALNTNYGLLIKCILDNSNTSVRTLNLIYENRKKYDHFINPDKCIILFIIQHPNTSLELLHEILEYTKSLNALYNMQYARAATEELILKCRAKDLSFKLNK